MVAQNQESSSGIADKEKELRGIWEGDSIDFGTDII